MIQTLADALAARGYETLTQVQVAVTKPELADADLLVSAQTGSGKTVGFGLAIGSSILNDNGKFGPAEKPLALVIAPTRELALQVKRELDWLYANTGATVVSCVGGMDMRDERRALARGAHIVVATPGRLRDHIMRNSMNMTALRAVVLDEADEMLDLGFREDLEFILGEAPEDRRTLMFSATVPKQIARLAQSYQNNAVRVTTVAETSQHSDIEYRAMVVSARDVENAIVNVLRYYEAPNALVFCNTRAMVNRLTTRFSNRGFSVVALSGELTQNERTHALQAMRDGRARICVATDVAARGIDLPNLELVIHGDLPTNSETLLHRSGRTGRAGRKGVSALIVPSSQRSKASRLLSGAKVTAEWGDAPTADEVFARDKDRILNDPAWLEPPEPRHTDTIEAIVSAYSAEQIAAAYMRLFAVRQSAPEDVSAAGPAGGKAGARGEKGGRSGAHPREEFGPSTWFSIAGGHDAGAEPRRILPMLCKAGNLTKEDLGAIRVRDDQSFVELRKTAVPGFLAALGAAMKIEGSAVSELAKAPDLGGSSDRGPAPRGKFGGKDKFGGKSDRPDRPYKGKSGARDGGYDKKPKFSVSDEKPPASKFVDDGWDNDWSKDTGGGTKPSKKKPKKDKDAGKPGRHKVKSHTPNLTERHEGAVEARGPGKPAKPGGKKPFVKGGKPKGAADPSKPLFKGKPRVPKGPNATPKRPRKP